MSVPVWINGLAYLPAVEHEALAAELAALEADDRKDLNEALLRIRSLEAALREMELQRDSWRRIAESGLGVTAETIATPRREGRGIPLPNAVSSDGPQSETPAPRAHSKSEFKRLTALGVECSPPETPDE